MSHEPNERKGLIELGWFGEMPPADAALARRNVMMQVVPGSTRYYCRVEGCSEFTDNVPYGYCSAHLGRALDGEPLPTKRGFPDVGTHDVGQQGVFHGAAALVERAKEPSAQVLLDEVNALADRYARERGGYCGNAKGVLLSLLEPPTDVVERAALEQLIVKWHDFNQRPIGYRVAEGYEDVCATLRKCADDLEALLRAVPSEPQEPGA